MRLLDGLHNGLNKEINFSQGNTRLIWVFVLLFIGSAAFLYFYISPLPTKTPGVEDQGKIVEETEAYQKLFEELRGTIYFAASPRGDLTFPFDIYTFDVTTKELKKPFPPFPTKPYEGYFHFRYPPAFTRAGDKMVYGEPTPITYKGEKTYWLQMFVEDTENKTKKQLTDSPFDITNYYKRYYDWSPDGTKVAFSALKEPESFEFSFGPGFENLDNWETFTTDLKGGIQLLGAGVHPAWSPDGHYLITLKSDGLEVFDIENKTSEVFTGFFGDESRKITLQSGFDLSFDGTQFALTDPLKGQIILYRIISWAPFSATEERTLTSPTQNSWEVIFSRDGTYLLSLQTDRDLQGKQYGSNYFAVFHIETGETKKMSDYFNEFDPRGMLLGDWIY